MGEFESLDQDEPLAQRMERHAYDRLIMLSDGVFAIAITLAALDVRPPANWNQDPATLMAMIGPALWAYAIAFVVISSYWMAHRRIIAMLRRVDGPATILNLAILALVALQPAAIKLLTEYRVNGGAGRIYFAQILLIGLTQVILWLYAWFGGRLIDPSIRPAARLLMLANMIITPMLGAWLGLSLGHTGNLTAYALVAAVAAVSIGRRALSKRVGL